ncbi:MAG: NHL repeat-containing protein, partial [Nitrospinota bacterium]
MNEGMEFLTTKEYNRGADETKAGPPSGLCRQGEAILLTDECNHRLECYFPLENRSTFFGKRGSGEGEFYYPKGVQVDRRGNIYVADCWNHRIQKFSTDWDFLLSFGKYGAGPAEFNEPYAIEIGPDDLLYVVDRCNHRIQVFTTTGKFKGSVGKRGTTLEGELAELYGTPENLFKKPSFEFPNDIAFDSSSNLFVVDSNNHRVVRLDKQGRFVFSFGTKGTGPGELKFPYGISIDQNDLLFVSDMNNERIQVFTPEGVVVGSFQECAQGKLTCPTTLNVTSSGELFFTTGFSSSLFKTGYSPVTPSELYSVDARKKKGELQVAFFQYEKESVEAAFEHFITFLKACDPSALLAAICENPDHIDFFFEKIQPTDLVKEKNFDAIAGLFERTFLKQKNRVNTQFIKRAELNRELFMSQQDREREILQGKDTYNTRFVTLEREDRELFRELRREMLTLKKVLSFQGSLLWKVFRHEPMSTETKDEVIVKTAEHIYSLIAFTLEMLTEREEIHARRETSFKDDKGNREENLSNFRFFTLLFDTLESFTQILLDLLRDHLKEALLNFSFFPPEKIGLFRSTAERCSGEGAFKDLVSKIFILTVDDPVPYYASIQKTLKEFTYTLYNSDVRIDFKNPFGVDRKEEILTQVFHLMVLEHTFLDLKKDFGFTIDPEIRKIHEGSFETLKNSISRTFEESERLASESALLDVQVNKTIVRDEKLRITMTNKLRLLSFAENLNFRTLGSLFLIQRINLLALTGIGEKGKRLDFINSLLGKSYESFFFLGKGEAEGDGGKRRGLLELKV